MNYIPFQSITPLSIQYLAFARAHGHRISLCRFGRDAPDAWEHYARCPRLQVALTYAAPPRVEGLSSIDLLPTNATAAEKERALRAFAARLHVYRTLRFGNSTLPEQRPLRGTLLLGLAGAAAHKFKTAVGETFGIPVPRISRRRAPCIPPGGRTPRIPSAPPISTTSTNSTTTVPAALF